MDTKLQRLVSDYQTVVSRRFTQLRTELGFAAPESDVAWACNDLEQIGRLSDGAQYFKHGYGCAITGATDSVDFDSSSGKLMTSDELCVRLCTLTPSCGVLTPEFFALPA
jgi:hypothetical protein